LKKAIYSQKQHDDSLKAISKPAGLSESGFGTFGHDGKYTNQFSILVELPLSNLGASGKCCSTIDIAVLPKQDPYYVGWKTPHGLSAEIL
jgi:hypothetical protein